MNLHQEVDRNKINYRGYWDTFIQAIIHERTPRGLYAGFYTWLLSTYFYAWLTIGITESFTDSWKRKEGLLEWQI